MSEDRIVLEVSDWVKILAGSPRENELKEIGSQLRAARKQLADVTTVARNAAVEAVAAGDTEVSVARALGIDRSRTLRRWLGK